MMHLVVKFDLNGDPLFRRYVTTFSQAEDVIREDVDFRGTSITTDCTVCAKVFNYRPSPFHKTTLICVYRDFEKLKVDRSFYAIYQHSQKA